MATNSEEGVSLLPPAFVPTSGGSTHRRQAFWSLVPRNLLAMMALSQLVLTSLSKEQRAALQQLVADQLAIGAPYQPALAHASMLCVATMFALTESCFVRQPTDHERVEQIRQQPSWWLRHSTHGGKTFNMRNVDLVATSALVLLTRSLFAVADGLSAQSGWQLAHQIAAHPALPYALLALSRATSNIAAFLTQASESYAPIATESNDSPVTRRLFSQRLAEHLGIGLAVGGPIMIAVGKEPALDYQNVSRALQTVGQLVGPPIIIANVEMSARYLIPKLRQRLSSPPSHPYLEMLGSMMLETLKGVFIFPELQSPTCILMALQSLTLLSLAGLYKGDNSGVEWLTQLPTDVAFCLLVPFVAKVIEQALVAGVSQLKTCFRNADQRLADAKAQADQRRMPFIPFDDREPGDQGFALGTSAAPTKGPYDRESLQAIANGYGSGPAAPGFSANG